jgi:pimeloyl-ACP methyl ester carboxylesterase
VQVIVGADDTLTPVEAARAIADGMARGRATVHVILCAGHHSNLEEPVAFHDAVRAFVARV